MLNTPPLAKQEYTAVISISEMEEVPSAIEGTSGISLVTPIFCANAFVSSTPAFSMSLTATVLME